MAVSLQFLSFLELLDQVGGEVFVRICHIDRFTIGRAVIVEFEKAGVVLDEPVVGASKGAGVGAVGNGEAFGFGGRILELGDEGSAVEEGGFFLSGEIAEGGEEVDGLDDFGAGLSRFFDLWGDDDEGRAE